MEYDLALPTKIPDFNPRLKENFCVIVVGLALHDNKVLLIQESKKSCRGQYFLPAGRLEVGELLTDGVRREVLEESGLQFHPDRCVLVEINGPFWVSITFIGHIVGGSLKRVADSESLGADWFSVDMIQAAERSLKQYRHDLKDSSTSFVLRAPIMHMIEAGLRYRMSHDVGPDLLSTAHEVVLRYVLYRLALVSECPSSSTSTISPHVLLSGSRLPAFRLNGGHPVAMIDLFIQTLFSERVGTRLWDPNQISVIGVDVTPRSESTSQHQVDGFVITLRILLHVDYLLAVQRTDYRWHAIQTSNSLSSSLKELLLLPMDSPLLPPFLFLQPRG